jgi:hypothetical protein
MYPWATKEYCLWSCDIGQLVFYYNEGMRQKYPQPEKEKNSMANMSPEDREKIRQELHAQFGEIG